MRVKKGSKDAEVMVVNFLLLKEDATLLQVYFWKSERELFKGL